MQPSSAVDDARESAPSSEELAALAFHLRAHLLSHGGMMMVAGRGGPPAAAAAVPVSLLPRPLPSAAVAAARALARPLNALVDALSRGDVDDASSGAGWLLRSRPGWARWPAAWP